MNSRASPRVGREIGYFMREAAIRFLVPRPRSLAAGRAVRSAATQKAGGRTK
jgi:hypothetical protein